MSETRHIIKWVNRTKQKLIDCMGGSCRLCGYNKCLRALEFHHIDPNEKEFTLSSWKCKNWIKIAEEARKCVLLCSNCHREVHDGVASLENSHIVFDEQKFENYKENPSYEQKVDWSKIDLLAELHTKTLRQFAVDHGISEVTVYKRMKYLGIKNPNNVIKTKFEITPEELKKLIDSGISYVKIGKMYGVTDNSIKKRAKKFGLI